MGRLFISFFGSAPDFAIHNYINHVVSVFSNYHFCCFDDLYLVRSFTFFRLCTASLPLLSSLYGFAPVTFISPTPIDDPAVMNHHTIKNGENSV